MLKKALFLFMLLVSFLAAAGGDGYAMDRMMHSPYGGYCRGHGMGWYGARRTVSTLEDARRVLGIYFKDVDVIIGTITERKWFFEAELKDKDDKVVDIVIVDKRTGRIRSIY